MTQRDFAAEAHDIEDALRELTDTLKSETPLLRASLSIWYWDLRRKVAEHIREER